MALSLRELSELSSIPVFDYLDMEMEIPVIDGLQAQGDLIVIPLMHAAGVTIPSYARWLEIPAAGLELLRGGAGGNTHSLVADRGSCERASDFRDPTRLTLRVVRTTSPAYLIHPEHGATGIARGTYVIRRQRQAVSSPNRLRRGLDWPSDFAGVDFVAD